VRLEFGELRFTNVDLRGNASVSLAVAEASRRRVRPGQGTGQQEGSDQDERQVDALGGYPAG